MKIKNTLISKILYFKDVITPKLEAEKYTINLPNTLFDFTLKDLVGKRIYKLLVSGKIENVNDLEKTLQIDLNDPFSYSNYCFLEHENYIIILTYGEIQPQLWELSLEAVFEKE
ncbi:hypothetical protein [Flammeovirga kamogawensis]|uniref:Uncharacterized protein n=1 Tax=Flammeovirga kamogawensis TaxID=373891 RepID=A0ABX8H4J4_9BACT|nr:hypothetical protein [Flammeovirga kamogawensis]MBB6460274.1 hypothetical protein [Flammeovirga kamogawensis]QWG10085.1 hypothetical protein KM029_20600 [Flammeovirga kamogawensis]TRX65592.1 hypothetical protein EO216_24030 [Flammeovirga kamogawensis]